MKFIKILLLISIVLIFSCGNGNSNKKDNNLNSTNTTKENKENIDKEKSLSKCEKVIKIANQLEGRPYEWGNEFREGRGGDCSGLIWRIHKYIGHPVPRTTAQKYWLMIDNKKKGWRETKCTDWVWWEFDPRRPFGHIGIMVKHPKFWQSGSSGGVYSRKFFEGSFWVENFVGAKSTD